MEYYSKCNVCGKITCYTDKDLKENNKQSIITGLAAISTIGNAVAGTKYDMYESSKFSNRASSKIVDYSKCPSCGSKDVVLVTKKFAIFSNKVKGNYSIDDLIKEANNYLDKSDFENAFCFATMVLNEDEKNYNAYLIRFLSSYEVKSLEEIDKLSIDYSNNQHFNNLLLVSDDTQKKKLLSSSDRNKYNIIFDNSKSILDKKDSEDIIEELEYYINELNNFDDDKSKNLSNKLDNKRKEIVYKLGCEYLKSEDISNLEEAIDLFDAISDYKDSNDKLKECEDKLKNNKVRHNRTTLIIVICIIFIISGFIIFITMIDNRINENSYKEANSLLKEKKYKEASEIYEELGGYKDSKKKKEKATLYNYVKSYNNEEAEEYFNNHIEDYELINDAEKIKKIFVNKWLVETINPSITITYPPDIEIFNADGTGYSETDTTFKDLKWQIKDGYLYYDSVSKFSEYDKYKFNEYEKYEFRKVSNDIYLLVEAYIDNSAKYIFILENSETANKIGLKN